MGVCHCFSITIFLRFCIILGTSKSLYTSAFLPNNIKSPLIARSTTKSLTHQKSLEQRHQPNVMPSSCPADATTTALFAALPLSPTITTTNSLYLVRIVFLRSLAFIYAIAFWVARNQNKALIGDHGITPARRVLNLAERRGQATRRRRDEWLLQQQQQNRRRTSSKWHQRILRQPLRSLGNRINRLGWYQDLREKTWDRSDRLDRPVTTLLWLAPNRNKLNPWLDGIALSGFAMALSVLVMGSANVPLLLALWICQRSLMAVGGPWYGYGWEPQLAELGFHALFLVPPLSLNPFEGSNGGVPSVVTWAMRWFLFRIMLGAGLIKLKPRADRKWKDLTAMNYFYETQPVPNPLTKYFHWMPTPWHKFEVLTNHFVETVAPWLLIVPGLPRNWRLTGGLIQLIFQAVLISSGNLSFLNWLTMVPALFSLDDAFVGRIFSKSTRAAAAAASTTQVCYPLGWVRQVVNVCFGVLIASLSYPVVKNLFSKTQVMNSSFDPLRLVNTYGAFGSVNEERYELIVKSANSVTGPWKEYEFKVKPGDVMRRPRWISPYHYRLDWQMWIACTCKSIERSPWMFPFLLNILEGNQEVLNLLEHDPWAADTNEDNEDSESSSNNDEKKQEESSTTGRIQPKYIRVDKYRYKFHKKQAGEKEDGTERYWDREYVGRFFPKQGVASLDGLKEFLRGT